MNFVAETQVDTASQSSMREVLADALEYVTEMERHGWVAGTLTMRHFDDRRWASIGFTKLVELEEQETA